MPEPVRYRLVLLSVILSLSCYAQEWVQSYQKAQSLYEAENLEEAFTGASQTLELYLKESGETNDNYAAILRLLGNICFSQTKFDKGLEFVQKEIQIRENKKDVVLATALSNAAEFHRQLGAYEKAIESLIKSNEILLNFYSPESNEVVATELNLAINHYLADQNSKAFELFSQSFKKTKETSAETLTARYYFGMLNLEMGRTEQAVYTLAEAQQKYEAAGLKETLEYIQVLKGLGEAYHQYNLFFKSEEAYLQGQQLCESLGLAEDELYFHLLNGRAVNLEALGKTAEAQKLLEQLAAHPEGKSAYATALNNSAALSQLQGDFAKAEKLYLQALGVFGKDDRDERIGYAETAENLALLYADRSEFEKASALMAESQQIIEQLFGKSHPRFAVTLNKAALIQFRQNLLAGAKTNYRQALTIQQSHPAGSELIVSLTGLAQCYQKEARYSSADSLYRIALSHYETGKLPQDLHYTPLLTNYASLRQEQGNWYSARDLMMQAVNHLRGSKGREHNRLAAALEDLAMLHLRLGNRQRTKAELDSAAMLFKTDESKKTDDYASLLISQGRYYQASGEYPQAESFYRQSTDLTFSLSGETTELYAYAINATALLYQTMGNYGDAEPLFKKALSIREQLNGKVNAEYSTVLQNLAALYQLEEHYDKAEPLLTEALETDRQVLGANHPQYNIGLQNLATLYQKKKQFDKASKLLEQVKTNVEKTLGNEHPSYATVISNLAALYQDKGQYDASETLWKESVALRKKILGEEHPDYARSLYGLAGVYFATGKLEQADGLFSTVISKYQNQVVNYFSALSEKEKSALYSRIKPVFESYQDFCVQVNSKSAGSSISAEKLFDLQLSTKAILLNASNKVRAAIQNSGDRELQNLFHQWQESKENLVRYYSYSREERNQLNINLGQLETFANDQEKKLSEKSSVFGKQVTQKSTTWKDVQAHLKDNETAIEIIRIRKKFVTDSVYYAALITSKSMAQPKLFIWPRGNYLENRAFRYHRNAIKFHFNDTLSYNHFWKPLAKVLPPSQIIYFSCDGVFNKINFNCLQDPVTKKWVLDEYTIRLLSNTRELTEVHPSMNTPSASAGIFGYADFNLAETDKAIASNKRATATRYGFEGEEIPMLPATEKEVNLLNEVLQEKNWSVNSFTLAHATEANLKKIANPRVLHVATHGFFLSDVDINDALQTDDEESQLVQNPLFRSGILLAGAALKQEPGQEDGVLTAYEAMNLNLDHTELVSLSACETGLGEVRNGEGVYGLQRSFLVAGARTVVMSLWQVDDAATQELMSTFYKNWLGGMDKFQAFREAQLEIKTKYELPFYWGAFVMIGN